LGDYGHGDVFTGRFLSLLVIGETRRAVLYLSLSLYILYHINPDLSTGKITKPHQHFGGLFVQIAGGPGLAAEMVNYFKLTISCFS
jgi:hypothetical protein